MHVSYSLLQRLATLANVAWQLAAPWHDLTQLMVHRCTSLCGLHSFAHLMLQSDLRSFMQATNFSCAGARQSTSLRSQTAHSTPSAEPEPASKAAANAA
ncbi:MAG TPA: hypothetical protein VNK48_01115 [Xanthobacteraceae bacterium]|nr:hypothetical protein [Xanthobacteraceae bacterium]